MKGSLNLGKVLGIKLQIHWTFLLLIAWIVFLEYKSGGNLQTALMSVVFVLALFVCVVLHELGHTLTASQFGYGTEKITLLPIGGVASLKKIPENPKQELLVAVAGPAVNIVIALILSLLLPVTAYFNQGTATLEISLSRITPDNFLFLLFVANIALAAFNFIPAFPMDGGRVLRALLAMKMNRVKATGIAAALGQFMAVIFFIVGLFFNPFLIFIALFIFIGAYGENKMVQQLAILKGHKVREAMLTNITRLQPENTIADVVEVLLAGSERDFLVTKQDVLLGVVYHSDILKHSKNRELPVKDIMHTAFKTIDVNTELKEIFTLIQTEKHKFFPVVEKGKPAGAIDLTNVAEFILLQSELLSKK